MCIFSTSNHEREYSDLCVQSSEVIVFLHIVELNLLPVENDNITSVTAQFQFESKVYVSVQHLFFNA